MKRRDMLRALAGLASLPLSAQADERSASSPNDNAIRIGNIMPYSGPASAFGTIGKTFSAYFANVNEQGGVNGRKIKFLSYDDGFAPSRTVEQARRLVEFDDVSLIFASLGTANNGAILKYMNTKRVPHLFIMTGAPTFNDPERFPWTMGWQPTSGFEAGIYAEYLCEHYRGGRIGILSENDDFGRDYIEAFKAVLGERMPIVAMAEYDGSDSTVDSELITLKAAGADVLFTIATPKFTAQAIRRTAEIGWKPMHIVVRPSSSVGAVLVPAGLENAKDLVSSAFTKDPTDPAWLGDPGVASWSNFMDHHFPDGDRNNSYTVIGYCMAQTLVQVLKQCGEDLTRENIMHQATNLKEMSLEMLLPGISVNTSATDYCPVKQLQLKRFNGARWELFGPIRSAAK
jgi:branched-chain amino acid transport system substrate-binding protein